MYARGKDGRAGKQHELTLLLKLYVFKIVCGLRCNAFYIPR